MKASRMLIAVLAALMAFGGTGTAFAKGVGGGSRNGGITGRQLGMQERVEKKGVEGREEGKHKGETKNTKQAKGTTNRATPATPAVPTPGTPGATRAIPATPSK